MGVEVRKIIHDGWPMPHTIATDLEAGMVFVCRMYSSRENNILARERILGSRTQVV